MKKKQVPLKLILLFIMVCMNALPLHSQVIDVASALKSLTALKAEKQQMFPLTDEGLTTKADSVAVQPQSKVSIDNPEAFQYRFDPMQMKSVFPEIVYSDRDNLIIDYYSLFPIMLELIIHQQQQIEELKSQVEELKKINP